MERDAPFPEPMVYSIFQSIIHISQSPQLSSPTRCGENIRSPSRGRKAYIQWSAAWFPSGIVYDIVITPPFSTVSSTLAPLASVCRSNPPQNVPSAPVTPSHVTQGKVPHNPEVRTKGWIYGRTDFLRSLSTNLKKL
jgi:hypothetical protein